jgi:hypothetical protein
VESQRHMFPTAAYWTPFEHTNERSPLNTRCTNIEL